MSQRCRVIRPSPSSPPLPVVPPVTVSDLRLHLRLPVLSPPDESEDAYLAQLLLSSLEEAEAVQGRDIVAREWIGIADEPLDARLALRAELDAILSVHADYEDGSTAVIDPSDYAADTESSELLWIRIPSCRRVRVRFRTRHVEAPETLRIGMLLLAGWLYMQRLPALAPADRLGRYPDAVMRLLRMGGRPHAAVF